MKRALRRMRPLLGTYVEIGALCASDSTEPSLLFEKAFAAIEQVQSLLSFHDPHSDLSRLNYAEGKPVRLQPDSIKVLRLAKAMSKASQGLFNPTVGGSLQGLGYLPDHSETLKVSEVPLPVGDAADIEIQGRMARLSRPIRVVLDGIAKGYAVDQAIAVLQAEGYENAWVNAGGDLRVYGEDLVLPLQIRRPEGLSESVGGIKNCAAATTVVAPEYDKNFPGWVVGNDKRPQTGVWTVLAKKAWRADALTKVASLCSDEERAEVIRRLGGRCL